MYERARERQYALPHTGHKKTRERSLPRYGHSRSVFGARGPTGVVLGRINQKETTKMPAMSNLRATSTPLSSDPMSRTMSDNFMD
jgi:hypothetical protein